MRCPKCGTERPGKCDCYRQMLEELDRDPERAKAFMETLADFLAEPVPREHATCVTCGARDVSQEVLDSEDRWLCLTKRECGHWSCPEHIGIWEDVDTCEPCYEDHRRREEKRWGPAGYAP